MAETKPTRLLLGCGYLGSRVAKLWRAAGDHTVSTSRGEDCTPKMFEAGVFTGQADVTKPETLSWFAKIPALSGTAVEALIYAIGYDRTAEPDIHTVYAGGLAHALAALPSSIQRAIYISTTGVYGSAGGDWVDETTPTDPPREGGKASLAAEQVLAAHPLGRRSAILRLAGIYGPGRVPYLDQLKQGEPIAAPNAGWLNLIHVDDAAQIVVAIDRWLAGRLESDGPHVFCVSDGSPVVRGDYYAEAARLIGAPSPTFATPTADSPAAARASANRRVSNAKLMATLDIQLAYPSYREGLAAILGDDALGGTP